MAKQTHSNPDHPKGAGDVEDGFHPTAICIVFNDQSRKCLGRKLLNASIPIGHFVLILARSIGNDHNFADRC
ncbi:MAG TPA: hypothetical protein DCM28_21510 [Phycisphaerales bacterium]|nr:hypothetical protein [Phycisphaerales bacterium]